jgi:F1F0 ATPase subunit 2
VIATNNNLDGDMIDSVPWTSIAAAIVAGILIGGVYFGGLWWTVRKMPVSNHPWGLYAGSLVIRSALVLYVMYLFLTASGVLQLLALLGTFLLVRMVMAMRLGRACSSALPKGEAAR